MMRTLPRPRIALKNGTPTNELPPFPRGTAANRRRAAAVRSASAIDRPDDSAPADMFDPSFPVPNNPALPEPSPIRPANGTREEPPDLRAARDKLLREVAGVLKASPAEQQAIVDQVESSLAGLPDQIKNAVVKDWYTDLLIYDRAADPDPANRSDHAFRCADSPATRTEQRAGVVPELGLAKPSAKRPPLKIVSGRFCGVPIFAGNRRLAPSRSTISFESTLTGDA